ncbi:MAG TPA: FAD-dependent oxidoreductase [Candidatus Thermoplasmatota archaeon]|nr:FAD-dependent oxidoreductase [Candidatus Thermoplasmatota archaeon]
MYGSGTTRPLWSDRGAPARERPPLAEDARAQTVVVGAGIAGLTAAYHLAREGRDVLLLEKNRIGLGESGRTTAHITHVVDTLLQDLVATHGQGNAKGAWDAGAFALDAIERIVRTEGIACGFSRVDGYLYGDRARDVERLQKHATLARAFGYEVEELRGAAIPIPAPFALRFPRQGKFDPAAYYEGLADAAQRHGARIHERTEVRSLELPPGDGAARLTTNDGATATAERVVLAANWPFTDASTLYTKLYPHRTYVVTARAPAGTIPEALYWEIVRRPRQPYFYLRVDPQGDGTDLLTLGGEDHKVGHGRPERSFAALEAYLRRLAPAAGEIEHRWSGQIVENMDDLPYIGASPRLGERVLLATAFSGNGMTFGTVAGWMLARRAMGHTTDWDGTFRPERMPVARTPDFVRQNADYPLGLVRVLLAGREPEAAEALPPGEGTVVVAGGRRVAVSRDGDGQLRALDATCSHMRCLVRWNPVERSWDCPCHGSRFAVDGSVLNGPATEPLSRVELPAPPVAAVHEPARARGDAPADA